MTEQSLKIEPKGHNLIVSGSIKPVNAIRKYDFSPLVETLILQGIPKDEAEKIVKELCSEIVNELTQMREDG